MGKISFYEVAQVLMEHNGLETNSANEFVKTMFDIIQERLTTDQQVKVKGLGTFKIVGVEARESINVNTGERILIEGHSKITFTPDSAMKNLINKPFSQFETVVLNDGVNFDDTKSEEPPVLVKDSPVVDEESPVITEELPVVEEKPSEVEEELPVVEEKPSEVEEELPVVEEEPSEVEEELPVVEEEPSEVKEELPVVEEEPSEVEEELPVVEEEPSEVEEELPVVEEEPSEVEDETPVIEDKSSVVDDGESVSDEEPERRSRFTPVMLCFISIIIVVVALAGFGGYWFGKNEPQKELASSKVAQAPHKKAVERKEVAAKTVVKPDTVSEDTVKSIVPVKNDEVNPMVKNDEVKAIGKTSAEIYEKYDKMDVRVRTGAYVIVGEKGTEKVRKGENVVRLSRRILGEGMECYIEVFNNINANTPLQEGQKIKIPELKLRKRFLRQKTEKSQDN